MFKLEKDYPAEASKLEELKNNLRKMSVMQLAAELTTPQSKFDAFSNRHAPFVFEFTIDAFNEKMWRGGPFTAFKTETPQTKGKLGEMSVKYVLSKNGVLVDSIHRGGDLVKIEDDGSVSEDQIEVKTKFANFKPDASVSIWFNQMRINYTQIKNYYFVVVFPHHIEILSPLNRDDYDFSQLANGHSGGTTTLKSVQLVRYPGTDVFSDARHNLHLSTFDTIYPEEIYVRVKER